MHLILLCHPESLGSASMPRFARMLGKAMSELGHGVTYWTSPQIFSRIRIGSAGIGKWLGYVDQFLLFPLWLRWQMKRLPTDRLVVVTDQALGMWVPAIRNHPHVIHCHDFLAQRSALGEFPENPTGWTGRIYQALIRRGYRQGKAFVSVSYKTRQDLHRFLRRVPSLSEVVYNPLNYSFSPIPGEMIRQRLGAMWPEVEKGYLLHVGGTQWYKNRTGVLALYRAYCERVDGALPLLLIGTAPTAVHREQARKLAHGGRVIFASGMDDPAVHGAYAGARVFLFPSLEEGFGWPIIEAQACGCPVLTTASAPMDEVGGDTVSYLPRLSGPIETWAAEGARIVEKLAALAPAERTRMQEAGLQNATRFAIDPLIERLVTIYGEAFTVARKSEAR